MTWLSLAFDPLKGHGFFLVHDETQALLTPAKLHSDLDLRFSVLHGLLDSIWVVFSSYGLHPNVNDLEKRQHTWILNKPIAYPIHFVKSIPAPSFSGIQHQFPATESESIHYGNWRRKKRNVEWKSIMQSVKSSHVKDL